MNTEKTNDEKSEARKRIPRLAASQSFTEEEVRWLHQVMMKMLKGEDTRGLGRSSVARKLFQKVQKMKDTVERVRRERAKL